LGRSARLSHGDFNAGNVLWSKGHLSGVVDWEAAETAPRASDVGACRFDLAVTAGTAAAEAFTDGYGKDLTDVWFWEPLTALKFISLYEEWLPVWHRFGLTQLTARTVRDRIDAAIEDALRRAV
jgi:aminoglycoside phosphotransferase (APT) family kinase protein